jgi:hypothetical protein
MGQAWRFLDQIGSLSEWRQREVVNDAGADFRHPAISPDHKLAPHVLYRIDRDDWKRNGRP